MYWIATTLKLATLLVIPAAVLHANIDWLFTVKSYFFIPAVNVDGETRPLLGVGWTLIFEMFFYLLFMLALLLRTNPFSSVGTVLVALSLVSVFKQRDWSVFSYYADPIVLNFLYGMIVAELIARDFRLPLFSALVAIGLGLVLLFVPIGAARGLYSTKLPVASGLLSVAVVYGCTSIDHLIDGRLPTRLLYLGAASYSLYLIHPLVAPLPPALLSKLGLVAPSLSIFFSVALALVFGALAYERLEKPITVMLKRERALAR